MEIEFSTEIEFSKSSSYAIRKFYNDAVYSGRWWPEIISCLVVDFLAVDFVNPKRRQPYLQKGRWLEARTSADSNKWYLARVIGEDGAIVLIPPHSNDFLTGCVHVTTRHLALLAVPGTHLSEFFAGIKKKLTLHFNERVLYIMRRLNAARGGQLWGHQVIFPEIGVCLNAIKLVLNISSESEIFIVGASGFFDKWHDRIVARDNTLWSEPDPLLTLINARHIVRTMNPSELETLWSLLKPLIDLVQTFISIEED